MVHRGEPKRRYSDLARRRQFALDQHGGAIPVALRGKADIVGLGRNDASAPKRILPSYYAGSGRRRCQRLAFLYDKGVDQLVA